MKYGKYVILFIFVAFLALVSSAQASWWNNDWNYMRVLTVEDDYIDEPLVNFPILVVIPQSIGVKCDNGNSIRFLSKNNVTEFSYDIEEWNSSSNSYVWVNISETITSSSDYRFILYYNNSVALDNQNITAVWDGFAAVYHLNESGTGLRYDATSNNADGTVSGYEGDEAVSGKVAGADNFDGINDCVKIDSPSSLEITENVTLSGWVNWDNYSDYAGVFGKGSHTGAAQDRGPYVFGNAGSKSWFVLGNGTTSSISQVNLNPNLDSWYYITCRLNFSGSDNRQLWLNDSVVDKGTTSIAPLRNDGLNAAIGCRPRFYNTFFDGIIDEVRITNGSRNDSWIKADFHTQNQTSGFLTFGDEQEHNYAPEFNNEFPSNGTGGVDFSPICSVTVSDRDNGTEILGRTTDGSTGNTLSIWLDTPAQYERYGYDSFTAETDGIAKNISVLLTIYDKGDARNVTCAIYYKDNNTFIAETEERNFTGAVAKEWLTFNFTEDVYLYEDTNYTLVVYPDIPNDYPGSTVTYVAGWWESNDNVNSGFTNGNDYPNWEDPMTWNTYQENMSIYCCYVPQFLTVNFYENTTGTWVWRGGNSSVTNGTNLSFLFEQAVEESTEYWWMVTCSDGVENVSAIYHFCTKMNATVNYTVYPLNQSTELCPCCITLCVNVDSNYDSMMNITFYSNLSLPYWDYFWLGADKNVTYSNVTDGSYCFNVAPFNEYDTTYYWNISIDDGTNIYQEGPFYFTTAEDYEDCDFEGGNSIRDDAWIVGLVLVFTVLSVYMRRKHR